ncbi:hypothetical protein GCM10022403_033320 [Streptomyces coacervatus]|uniref:Barstar (barnase inhibitor) domain-containing protein n=1 Tax=Streptomyces coacervatus TaxID=647381 RepID=A0ABP7HSF9_9ACTN|nr:barstar family protein [Streptomyces coacervatus]MDF2272339.1 barstar family protein [Streptomyces coacervatus]
MRLARLSIEAIGRGGRRRSRAAGGARLRCRPRQGLFIERARRAQLPEHFGHNWDAFYDCLRDTVSRAAPSAAATIGRPAAPLTVIVREAGDLLADEPDNALATLVSILGGIADDGGEPRLLLVLDDTPDRLSHLERRMAAAGC